MFLVSRVDTIAPLARLAVHVLPTGESAPGKKVVLYKMEVPFDACRTISIADLMRLELKAETFGESRHLGHGNHFAARASQHHHMRVVDHDALRRPSGVTQRVGEKHFAVETLKGGIDLKEQHPRVTQHSRCGLRLAFLAGDGNFVRRRVVLHLFTGFEGVAAGGHDGLLSDTLAAAESG